MKTIAIDANIILRYLLADHPVFSVAKKLDFQIGSFDRDFHKLDPKALYDF